MCDCSCCAGGMFGFVTVPVVQVEMFGCVTVPVVQVEMFGCDCFCCAGGDVWL